MFRFILPWVRISCNRISFCSNFRHPAHQERLAEEPEPELDRQHEIEHEARGTEEESANAGPVAAGFQSADTRRQRRGDGAQ